jgi:malto-oligosyltrehalose trehalohydrolase
MHADTATRLHRMPFGAEVLPGGGVRFRLWAPAARRVELLLTTGGAEHALPMHAAGDGWHERLLDDAGPGTRYRYRCDGGLAVPDPASRFQPDDVHGPSEVIDPAAFHWQDGGWRGRPWREAVIYELHAGAFSSGGGGGGGDGDRPGGYAGIEARLDYLAGLGVTAVELMPLADFPGRRGWGYDGALLFAPDAVYGRPEHLKRLVQAAHARGLMVLLDVVYNHFGPEGNYLHLYAPAFFHQDRHTPWGAAIDFDGPQSRWVREFFIHNALYWLQEYRFDGLRLDAVDRIADSSEPDILEELADRVHDGPGREREIHLILENDHNDAQRYRRGPGGAPVLFTAQWNDDFHHACHALLTGEQDGPYQDFHVRPLQALARALAEGFAYQGEASAFRDRRPRGTPSAHLPPLAFVSFLQNHDQAGNRAFGERLHQLVPPEAMDAALALLLLAPSPPLLFMGEEFDAPSPFLFFCDFGPELAAAVRDGRRREFARSAGFSDARSLEAIPDPNAALTFERSCLDWSCLEQPRHRRRLTQVCALLRLRSDRIVPLLPRITRGGHCHVFGVGGLDGRWDLGAGETLRVTANLAPRAVVAPPEVAPHDPDGVLLAQPALPAQPAQGHQGAGELHPWSIVWSLGST